MPRRPDAARLAAALAALTARAPGRRALVDAARLAAAEDPAVAGLWSLGDAGGPVVALAGPRPPGARDIAARLLDAVAAIPTRARFRLAPDLEVRVLHERAPRPEPRDSHRRPPRLVLGGVILRGPPHLASLAVLEPLLRLWLGRQAALLEAAAHSHALALVRSLADGLLEEGQSPLGLDRLLVKLRNVVPCDLLSLALPDGEAYQVIHVLPGGVDVAVARAMQREVDPALDGRPATSMVEPAPGVAASASGRRVPRSIRASLVLPVPDPDGGAPGFLALHSATPAAIAAHHMRSVSLIVPGLARALESARDAQLRHAADRDTRADLDQARLLQRHISSRKINESGNVEMVDLAVSSTASAGVSGDFHDVVRHEGRLAVLVADVCGHGIAAALQGAFLQGVLSADRDRAPAARLARLNASLFSRGSRETDPLLVSVSAAVLDPVALSLTHCEAGHPAPLIARAGRAFEASPRSSGLLLGVTPGWRGRATTTRLRPGDLIVFYTDGVIEASAPDGQRFGKPRLQALCERLSGATAAEALAGIEAALADFTSGAPAADDRTVVAICLA